MQVDFDLNFHGVAIRFYASGIDGTASGIVKKLKKCNPNTKFVGVDPFGSILSQLDNLN